SLKSIAPGHRRNHRIRPKPRHLSQTAIRPGHAPPTPLAVLVIGDRGPARPRAQRFAGVPWPFLRRPFSIRSPEAVWLKPYDPKDTALTSDYRGTFTPAAGYRSTLFRRGTGVEVPIL